jgi:hypothetical protein
MITSLSYGKPVLWRRGHMAASDPHEPFFSDRRRSRRRPVLRRRPDDPRPAVAPRGKRRRRKAEPQYPQRPIWSGPRCASARVPTNPQVRRRAARQHREAEPMRRKQAISNTVWRKGWRSRCLTATHNKPSLQGARGLGSARRPTVTWTRFDNRSPHQIAV